MSNDQAGAVAWISELSAPGMKDDGMRIGPFWQRERAEEWAPTNAYTVRGLYLAPPAAVPVEALEGLVGRLNALEEYADEARVAYAGDHSSGTFRRIAERTQGIRDELTQLIKERSNG